MKELQRQSTEVNNAITELEEKRIPTKEYEEASKKVEDLTKKVKMYQKTKEEFDSKGLTGTDTYAKIVDYLTQATAQLKEAQNEQTELVNSGKAFSFASETDAEHYRELDRKSVV